MLDFSAFVFQGTYTSFCIRGSFVISHALSALFDVCVGGEICRSKIHDDEPSNFDDAKSPSN